MWVTYFFISYMALALVVPAGWALLRVWLKARESQMVFCPAAGRQATVNPDPWYAVRMHARGDRELCVQDCSEWPQRRGCEQPCRARVN